MGNVSYKIGGTGFFDVDRNADAKLRNIYVSIKEAYMGGGNGSCKSDRIATVEVLKKRRRES